MVFCEAHVAGKAQHEITLCLHCTYCTDLPYDFKQLCLLSSFGAFKLIHMLEINFFWQDSGSTRVPLWAREALYHVPLS